MDATHYDKIADKLIQFRCKLPQKEDLEFTESKVVIKKLKLMIDDLMEYIDTVAHLDDKGWFR